ncbi:hypothetical protein [Streptomyces cadmiisoli]|uniref:Uncharacterized protein n=1 Tax=Streptomyces cadmiisoli TaxID=2184053 RepID=A0A2Z4JAN6_9ACTN|nr:hypothetical protein [Streptomyces cadmiisoli]AWW41997.1 hypothetical protein DN051_39775 [Streptomyces cadmiisoli]
MAQVDGSFAERRRIFSSVLSAGLSAVVLAGCTSIDADGQSPTSAPTPVSAQRMVSLLENLLPEGKFSSQQGKGLGDKSGPPPSAQLVFDRGGRAAKVTVILNKYPVPVPEQVMRCPDTAYHPYSQCTETQLPGGAVLVRDQSPKNEDDPSGARLFSTLLAYKDGGHVYVSEVGDPGDKTAAGDTPLPLTLKQISDIATSSAWKPVLSSIPAPPSGARTESAPRMTGEQISRTIEHLLPADLHASRRGGSEGFGHIVVDDSRGKSLVTSNVQRWKPDDSGMTELFKKAATLPDGTRIRINKRAAPRGGKGAVEWSVDALRKNGLRVVISAVNARAYGLPPDRSEPALDIRQLKQMALDPVWQRSSGS